MNNIDNDNTVDDVALAKVAAKLAKENADHLDTKTQARLAQARQKAVSRLVALERTQTVGGSQGVLHWVGRHFGPYFSQHRAISAAFAIMLVTFFAVQQFSFNDDLEHSDAFLLAAELPPEAFADKGFNTWLVSRQN